jgi:hypothetical protein
MFVFRVIFLECWLSLGPLALLLLFWRLLLVLGLLIVLFALLFLRLPFWLLTVRLLLAELFLYIIRRPLGVSSIFFPISS